MKNLILALELHNPIFKFIIRPNAEIIGKWGARMRKMKNTIGNNKKGFSLIEVLIGMLILAFGLLAVGGMQVVSIKGGSFSNNVTKATILAQSKMEDLKRLTYTFDQTDANLSSGVHDEGTLSNLIFSRRYDVADTTSTLKTITVTVQWADRGGHSVTISTMRAQQ